MESFKLNNTKYKLPTSWEEVPYSTTMKLTALEREELEEHERAAKIVSILTNIDYDYLTSFDAGLVFSLFHRIPFLEETVGGVIQHFTHRGETFYVNTLEEESFLAFVIYNKIEQQFKDTPEEGVLHKMALLCRKEGETVKDMDAKGGKLLEERASMFRELPTTIVQKVNTFFLGRWILLQAALPAYSLAQAQLQETEREFLKAMNANGDGKGLLTGWRMKLASWILSITAKRAKYLAG